MKYISIILPVFMLMVIGCGTDDNDCSSAPSGSVITINPSDFTWTDTTSSITWNTHPFTISVKDRNGNPMNKTRISIYFPLAVPLYPNVQLYNGSTAVNSPFSACTDNYGVYQLRFDYQAGGGLDYFGDLEVRSGDAFQDITITVTSQS